MSKLSTQSPESLNAQLNLYDADGNIQFDKDKEAARQYFLQHVNQNTIYFNSLEEKLSYLVDNEYWEEGFLLKYDGEFIKDLFKDLYNENHRFGSYLSALKFYKNYALKTSNGERYLERWEDRCAAVGLYLADGDEQLAHNIAMMHLKGEFQSATPTFMNSGKASRGELVSCFLLNVQDSTESILRTMNSAAALSRAGGGIGLNISNLRPAGAPIRGMEGVAAGLIPFMKTLENTVCFYFNQLGQRQGSAVCYLNIFHPDILLFLDTKKENADDAVRLKALSAGLIIPDIFMEKAAKNEDVYLISPYELLKETGTMLSDFDFTANYEELIKNPKISKEHKVSARKILTRVAEVQAESGYPYVLFIDAANRSSAVPGRIGMSNLCSEILQPQTSSQFNSDFTYAHIGTDIACNLGSLVIDKVMDSTKPPEEIIETAIRALTSVSDLSVGSFPAAPTVDKGNREAHSIGLSAMNLHGYLARENIHYGSEESIEFTSAFFMMLRFYALKASNKIAVERWQTFRGFEESEYASGKFFDKYLDNSFEPKSKKVKDLFSYLPTAKDWAELKEEVMSGGLYNRELMCEPPTGSISYVQHSTNSVMPISDSVVETRYEGNGIGKVFYPQPFATNDNIEYFEDAYSLGHRKIIDVIAAAQEHIDQGISMNMFFKEGATTRDITKALIYAWRKGLKTTYYTRFSKPPIPGTEIEECVSCSL